MKYILNDISDRTTLLQFRAAQSCDKKDIPIGESMIVEFENGAAFECRRNKHSISVWPQ